MKGSDSTGVRLRLAIAESGSAARPHNNPMTITISTKESIWLGVIALFSVALGVTAFAVRGNGVEAHQPQPEDSSAQASYQNVSPEILKPLEQLPAVQAPLQSCSLRLSHSPQSSVFDGSNPYSSIANMGIGSTNYSIDTFQDINGDNLPDWLYIKRNEYTVSYPIRGYSVTACIEVNVGNGWAKAFECQAQITFNEITGDLDSQIFQGDCAGH